MLYPTELLARPPCRTRHHIGAAGFEPATSWSQTRRAPGLRHAPLRVGKAATATQFSPPAAAGGGWGQPSG